MAEGDLDEPKGNIPSPCAQMEGEDAGLTFKSTSRNWPVTRGRLDLVCWMLPSKSRDPSAEGRGRESAIPCWTWLQIPPLPCLELLFTQKSLAFSGALGRELLGTPAPGTGQIWGQGGAEEGRVSLSWSG